VRTGADYREALRDGRKVWVMGEGAVDDVTTHPATSAMVGEYVAWYDRHHDPAWHDILLAPAGVDGKRTPWAFVAPHDSADLVGMGRSFAKTTFLGAGNITHTPAYGHLISLGVLTAVQECNASPGQVANALAYRKQIAETGRFLTFCGGAAPIGFRMRENPAERASLKLVRETDAGVVLNGKVGMHTSPGYAEDVYVGALNGVKIGERSASFIVPVGAPGVTTVCRKIAARAASRFNAPLTQRFDELDGQMRTCSSRGSGCFWSSPRRSRSRPGCSGITSTAGSPRPR
jgi:4-hydroxyphenylacetate 3-monooxygenase